MAIVKLMIGYALLLIALGGLALALAPDPSRAATALIVTGICATFMVACAGMASMLGKSKPIGMIGIHLGLLLPLLYTAAFTERAISTHGAVGEYNEQRERFADLVASEIEQDTDEAFNEWQIRQAFRTAFEDGKIDETVSIDTFTESPDYARQRRVPRDRAYLLPIFWALAATSIVSFGLMLSKRPKPGDRVAETAKPDAETDAES